MAPGVPFSNARWAAVMLLCFSHEVTSSSFVESMTSLRANLTGPGSKYDRRQRPAKTTLVTLQVDPKSLVKLNTAQQWMEMMLMVTLTWEDSRLAWGQGGAPSLLLYGEDIWTPPVFVQNALSAMAVKADMPVETTSRGRAQWSVPLSTTTSCQVSTRFYPFDTQNCHVNFMPWARREMIQLVPHPSNPISTDIYMKNAEWDLMDASMTSFNLTNGDSVYSIVSINFRLRRKSGYYVCALVAPVMGTAILMSTVFWVPAASGEKMSYSLTVLLAFVVLLTIVSDQLPPIETDTSLLQLYLTIVLVLGVAATMLTTFILRIYNTDETEETPDWLKRLVSRARWLLDACTTCPPRRRPPCPEPVHTLSWKDVAVMLDAVLLRVYVVFILLLTLVFGGMLVGS